MKKIIEWIVISSANPAEVSTTVKGILLQYAGLIVSVFTLFHIGVTYETVVEYISQCAVLLGAMLSVFGLLRKLYYTVKR